MGKAKKHKKSMAELTAGYEDLMKGKKPNSDGKDMFKNAIKQAVKAKPHGSK